VLPQASRVVRLEIRPNTLAIRRAPEAMPPGRSSFSPIDADAALAPPASAMQSGRGAT
jgi:hypothetical protein